MKRTNITLLLVGIMIVSTLYTPLKTEGKKTSIDSQSSGEFVKGRIIIGYEDSKSSKGYEAIEALVKKYGLSILYKDDDLKFAVVKVEEGKELEMINKVKNEPGVVYAEPDYIVHVTSIPNDPYWPDQWALTRIKCPKAWERCTGSKDIVVAILDTGVDYEHEDLSANMWHNPGEIPDNGIDDDGNGYVDDYYGWNFVDNNGDPMDECHFFQIGHGTQCAGIVAAVMDNNIGIAGIAQVKIMAVKVLGGDGSGSWSDVIKGIEYAADNGADVISMSFGSPQYSRAVERVCQDAWENGVILVAAAGNEGKDSVEYPAAYDTVIAVGAIDCNRKLCVWSNYGEKIELVAPGESVITTFLYPSNKSVPKYGFFDGTSAATPIVAGVAALAKALHPDYTNQQIRELLRQSADDLGPLGKDKYYGYGLVDASLNKNDNGEIRDAYVVKIRVRRVDLVAELPEGGIFWRYYTIRVISGDREERVVNYEFLPNKKDVWEVRKAHILPVYNKQQVKIVIHLRYINFSGKIFTADLSSNPNRKEFVIFYDLKNNAILPNSDKVEKHIIYYKTSGKFDGNTNAGEYDAELRFRISDNYGKSSKSNYQSTYLDNFWYNFSLKEIVMQRLIAPILRILKLLFNL